jgi:hypothetical protein
VNSGNGGVRYAIDSHCHLGRFFQDPAAGAARIDEMRRGAMTACVAAVIGDWGVIGMTDQGLRLLREPEPGELFADTERDLDRLIETCGLAGASIATCTADIEKRRKTGVSNIFSAAACA